MYIHVCVCLTERINAVSKRIPHTGENLKNLKVELSPLESRGMNNLLVIASKQYV